MGTDTERLEELSMKLSVTVPQVSHQLGEWIEWLESLCCPFPVWIDTNIGSPMIGWDRTDRKWQVSYCWGAATSKDLPICNASVEVKALALGLMPRLASGLVRACEQYLESANEAISLTECNPNITKR